MKPHLMISYSRAQTPFVDALYKDIVRMEYGVWLDYQWLVPSEPWFDQVTKAVKGSDIILLVVSRDSLASRNVADEWQLALEHGKRVILVLFEATPIENEKLKKCEWVDFRSDYKAGLKQLDTLLTSAPQPLEKRLPVPERGFKASLLFWVALVISVALVVASISVFWAIFIPLILIPLPQRILKRNYNFSQVAPTLLLMPLFYVITIFFIRDEGNILFLLPDIIFTLGFATVLSWVLLVLLVTPGMRRRARPEAVPARVVNRSIAHEYVQTNPLKFYIDHAPEDWRYANDLRRALEKRGHPYVEPGAKPQAVFVLLSAYKHETLYQAGNGVSLFPVILQKTGKVAGELGKLQRLDFRRGMQNLDRVATLLSDPARLVKALAVPPTGRQEVFPLVVNALQFFYLITGALGGGSLLISVLSLARLELPGQAEGTILFQILAGLLNGMLLFGAVILSVQALRTRKGGVAAIYPLVILTVMQALLHFTGFFLLNFTSAVQTGSALELLIFSASGANGYAVLEFLIGVVIVLPFLLFGWRDLFRWMPVDNFLPTSRLEKALLLYSPKSKLKLIFHLLFHAVIVIFFIMEGTLSLNGGFVLLFLAVPAALAAFFFHWLATRTWSWGTSQGADVTVPDGS